MVLCVFPKRYILSMMIFGGFFAMSSMRVNLNVAIGAMINNHTRHINGFSVEMKPDFEWDSKLQGVILGSFYYGYMIFQLPGGILALRLGGVRLFGIGVCVASALTLLTPLAARISPVMLIILRILEGLALGSLMPCNHAIWSKWAPPAERTTLVTISVTGTGFGYLVTMPISGLLTKYGFDGGWSSVFYCFGAFGLMWYGLWLLVVHDSPSTHPTITKEERTLLEEGSADIVKKGTWKVPWGALLTSKPVWAIIAAGFASDWGFYILLISMPLYLLDVLHVEVHEMGFLAAAPFLTKVLATPLSGLASDLLRRNTLSTKNARRLFFAVGSLCSGVLVLLAGYSCSVITVVICITLAGITTSVAYPAYTVNMLDIAPQYAGVIMGIVNTIGTSAGFLSPMLVGFITQDKTASEWYVVFWITFLIYVASVFVFSLMMSGERQPWDKIEPTESLQLTLEDDETTRAMNR